MPVPFAFSGTLQIPSDPSLPPDGIPVNMAGQFSSENVQILNLTGSGTKTIPFGTVGTAGLNGLLIRVDANPTGAPVYVTINGGSQALEISPGGFISWGNPNPVLGATALSVAWSSVNVVRIWALGP